MYIVTSSFIQLPQTPVTVLILFPICHDKATVFDVINHGPRSQPSDCSSNRLTMADNEHMLALKPVRNVLKRLSVACMCLLCLLRKVREL